MSGDLKDKKRIDLREIFRASLFIAIVLTTFIGLTACSSEEPYAEYENQTYFTGEGTLIQWSPGPFKDNPMALLPDTDIKTLQPAELSILKDSTVIDHRNGCQWNYAVVLPSSYDQNPETTYPVIFLLHGLGVNYFDMALSAQKAYNWLLEKNRIPECILITPDAGNSYYVDGYTEIDYETFFIREFVPRMERRYRISKNKNERMLCGFSMGGYGATYYSFKYPEKFGYCYAMSGALDGKGTDTTPPVIEFINYKKPHPNPMVTLDIGNADKFVNANGKFTNHLKVYGVAYEYILREGGHNWAFWRQGFFIAISRFASFMEMNPIQ